MFVISGPSKNGKPQRNKSSHMDVERAKYAALKAQVGGRVYR